jgi:hypothetical protein
MSVERERLLSIIEFAQHSARLRYKPASTVAAHGTFALYEHEVQGLPGIRLNVNGPESADELWLAVERLHETRPPEVGSTLLSPWVQLTQTPAEEPRLLETVDGASLVAADTDRSVANSPASGTPDSHGEATITLADIEDAAWIRAQFDLYVATKWRPWAEEERRRRKTIRLYSRLFTLKQELEGALVEAQLELVWAVGHGVWNCESANVSYPVVGQLVEVALNPVTAELEIRPRDVDPRIETDWYASVDNHGVADL